MELIRKISGIRGIVDDNLTDDVVYRHSLAFSKIQPKGPILIARDTRLHGKKYLKIVSDALIQSGRDVIDCQIIPTPTAQFLISKKDISGGIVITASHNPIEWNGMKFIDTDGCFINQQKNNQLFSEADLNKFNFLNKTGKLSILKSAHREHIDHTKKLSYIDINKIKKRKFKIVVDAVNGAASFAIPELLSSFGCNVIPLYCSPNGSFPHNPEPLNSNLSELCNTVVKSKADLGLAIDPDGDRLSIIDDKGIPMGEENTLVISAESILSNGLFTPIVTNLSTTMGIDMIASKYNIPVFRSSVGEINVIEMMKKINSKFGGEGNGGVILEESHLGRDAIVGTALVLQWLSVKDEPLSCLRNFLPKFSMIKDKINLNNLKNKDVLKIIDNKISAPKKNTTDGLKLIWDNSWVHIRESNTEPIIRIYAEAPTKNEAALLINKVKKCVK